MVEVAFVSVKKLSFRQRKGTVPPVDDESATPLPRSGLGRILRAHPAAEGNRGQSRAGAAMRGAAATTEATFPRRRASAAKKQRGARCGVRTEIIELQNSCSTSCCTQPHS